MEFAPPRPVSDDDELPRRRVLLERHEELLSAARAFGDAVAESGRDWGELEATAGELDEAARAYAAARWEYGPCSWVVSEVVVMEGAALDPDEFIDAIEGLRQAAEAVADMALHDDLPAAVEATRSVLGKAATRFYELSRAVAGIATSLRREREV